MWKHVSSVNNVSLNNFSKFRYLKTHHIQGHGAGKSSASSKDKMEQRDASDLTWRKSDPCHLWNDGKCNHQACTCKFRHICKLCWGSHHKGSCPGRILMLDWDTAHCTSEWSWYLGIHAIYQIAVNFKPPQFLLGAAKKNDLNHSHIPAALPQAMDP
jgi:hypothetical protein